jgi:hypothetical protein
VRAVETTPPARLAECLLGNPIAGHGTGFELLDYGRRAEVSWLTVDGPVVSHTRQTDPAPPRLRRNGRSARRGQRGVDDDRPRNRLGHEHFGVNLDAASRLVMCDAAACRLTYGFLLVRPRL